MFLHFSQHHKYVRCQPDERKRLIDHLHSHFTCVSTVLSCADMGWGLELWDKEAEMKAYVDDGIKFIDKARTFAFEVSKLESIFGQQVGL